LSGNGGLDAAGIAVEALAAVIKADIDHNLTDELVEVDESVGGDLAEKQNETGLDRCFAGYASGGILGQERVENSIADLVAHLVRMSLRHGFRREEKTR